MQLQEEFCKTAKSKAVVVLNDRAQQQQQNIKMEKIMASSHDGFVQRKIKLHPGERMLWLWGMELWGWWGRLSDGTLRDLVVPSSAVQLC